MRYADTLEDRPITPDGGEHRPREEILDLAIHGSTIRQPKAKPVAIERLDIPDAQHHPGILVERSNLDEWLTETRAIPIIQQPILMKPRPVRDEAERPRRQ